MKRLSIALCLIIISQLSHGAQSGLWLTGDVRGALLPCFQCPEAAEPGLARQLAVMQESADDGVWLDAGGFLDGGDVDALGIRASLALADTLGMQALHLTWRDVSPALVEALSGSRLPLTSASIVDAQGEPIVAPSQVVEHDGQRIGIIGISGVPSSYLDLPAWQSFAETFRLREAGEALSDALDGLPDDVDRVVVLYAGDHGILRSLITQEGEGVDAFVMGSSFGNLYSEPPEAVIDARSQRGRRVTQLRLPDLTATYHSVTLNSTISESTVAAMEQAGLRHAPPEREYSPSVALPADSDLAPPFRTPLLLEQANRVMAMTVLGIETRSEWQGRAAPDGDAYLVLDLLFENRKPFDLIQQDSGQRALQVGNLEQNLVLVAGSKTHGVINEQLPGAGLLPDTFVLPRPGEVARGKAVYRLANDQPGPLSLRFYHTQYPVLAMALQQGEAAMVERRVDDLQQHGFLELGVADLEENSGEQLPDGRRLVAVELLGRSRLTHTTPANHHDAEADPEARVETPGVVPYLHAAEHIQLVTPSGYVYLPDWERSELERTPIFLPDLLTGGRVVFALPEAVDTYRVSLYFPNFGTSTGGTQGFPEPMFFGDNSERFAYRERDTVVDFGLEQLRVRATELVRTADGLEMEIEIFNETDAPGFWPMESRLGITPAGRQRRITPTEMTDSHGTPQPWSAHLPPGEPRRMRLHFPLPEPRGEGELDVRGLSANSAQPIRWDEHSVEATGRE